MVNKDSETGLCRYNNCYQPNNTIQIHTEVNVINKNKTIKNGNKTIIKTHTRLAPDEVAFEDCFTIDTIPIPCCIETVKHCQKFPILGPCANLGESLECDIDEREEGADADCEEVCQDEDEQISNKTCNIIEILNTDSSNCEIDPSCKEELKVTPCQIFERKFSTFENCFNQDEIRNTGDCFAEHFAKILSKIICRSLLLKCKTYNYTGNGASYCRVSYCNQCYTIQHQLEACLQEIIHQAIQKDYKEAICHKDDCCEVNSVLCQSIQEILLNQNCKLRGLFDYCIGTNACLYNILLGGRIRCSWEQFITNLFCDNSISLEGNCLQLKSNYGLVYIHSDEVFRWNPWCNRKRCRHIRKLYKRLFNYLNKYQFFFDCVVTRVRIYHSNLKILSQLQSRIINRILTPSRYFFEDKSKTIKEEIYLHSRRYKVIINTPDLPKFQMSTGMMDDFSELILFLKSKIESYINTFEDCNLNTLKESCKLEMIDTVYSKKCKMNYQEYCNKPKEGQCRKMVFPTCSEYNRIFNKKICLLEKLAMYSFKTYLKKWAKNKNSKLCRLILLSLIQLNIEIVDTIDAKESHTDINKSLTSKNLNEGFEKKNNFNPNEVEERDIEANYYVQEALCNAKKDLTYESQTGDVLDCFIYKETSTIKPTICKLSNQWNSLVKAQNPGCLMDHNRLLDALVLKDSKNKMTHNEVDEESMKSINTHNIKICSPICNILSNFIKQVSNYFIGLPMEYIEGGCILEEILENNNKSLCKCYKLGEVCRLSSSLTHSDEEDMEKPIGKRGRKNKPPKYSKHSKWVDIDANECDEGDQWCEEGCGVENCGKGGVCGTGCEEGCCGVDNCATDACGTGCKKDACGVDNCATDACGVDNCATDACGVDNCATDACGVDNCEKDACGAEDDLEDEECLDELIHECSFEW